MKKVVVMLMALAMFAGVLGGCSPSDGAPASEPAATPAAEGGEESGGGTNAENTTGQLYMDKKEEIKIGFITQNAGSYAGKLLAVE